MEQEQSKNKKYSQNNLNIPIAIVIVGILVAGAIFFSGGDNKSEKNEKSDTRREIAKLVEIQKNDHILGNPDAKITVLEFSDTECPFCKRFHTTMHQIVDEYEDDVRWVYRHFPIDSIHSKARKEAQATECAWELGGNDGFWRYVDRIFEITPSNNGLDLSILPDIAQEIGLDRSSFEECLSSERYTQHVEDDLQNGISVGVRGTPHSLILFEDEIISIEGAQPYDVVKSAIDSILERN